MCFLLIYSKPYNHSKYRILNSKSIGRFFLTQFSSRVTRKREKERKMHMRNLMSNILSEKRKIFYIRVLRNVFPKILIVWKFPDHLIVFGENGENMHIGI